MNRREYEDVVKCVGSRSHRVNKEELASQLGEAEQVWAKARKLAFQALNGMVYLKG